MEAHIAKIFDSSGAADRLLKGLLTSSSIMEPATFVIRKKDTTLGEKKCSAEFASKQKIDVLETDKDVIEALPSCSNSRSDEKVRKKLLKRRSKHRHSMLKNKDVKQNSSTSTYSKREI